ncbi:MAG: hypothetical protein LUB59_06115 [Candidatus Gastranaerophilales bacterium]|nr:hypothetical protein [Candidatus Gastranaerophilales bacterium]
MRVLTIILTVLMLAMDTAFASPYTAKAKTARIPAGTKLSLQLLQTVDTVGCQEGDSFNLMLLCDQKIDGNVVLPSGSVIRGCIQKVKISRRLSRGAVLYLDFDHVVTPTGRQLPIGLSVFGLKTMTYDGGIYKTKGYGQALHDNWTKTCDITKVSTNYGKRAKNVIPGSQFVTTPICALGGAIGGFCYLVGDSVADLFKKGDEVTLLKGSILEVILTQPIDVPIS